MKKILFSFGLISIILFASCDKIKIDALSSESLQEKFDAKSKDLVSAELGTVEYSVKKIIKADDSMDWYTIGDRKILFSCKATLKAGVKLDNFNSENVVINEENKSAVVTLPHAELLSMNMSPDDIKLEYQNVGVFRSGFSAKERNSLLEQGEVNIKGSVEELGIIRDAEKQATDFMVNLLTQLGFQSVTVKFE